MKNEMDRLEIFNTLVENEICNVKHKLILTMIDTKIINTLEGNKATTVSFN